MPSTCTLLLLLPVHHTAANQSETKKGGTGELEHLELSVVDNKEDGDKAGDCTEQRHTKQHKSELDIVFNIDAFKMLPKCKVVFCKTRGVVCTCVTALGAGQADVQCGVGCGPGLQRVRVCDLRQDQVNNVLYIFTTLRLCLYFVMVLKSLKHY